MTDRHKKTKDRLLQALFWAAPILFLTDDVLGVNGYQFTVAGVSIRILLFCLTCGLLYSLSGWLLWRKKASLPQGQALFRPEDGAVLLFVLGNFLWAAAIPHLVRGENTYALKDFSTVLVLVLYFPLAFLIRAGVLRLKRLETLFYILCAALALWHGVMYVGEVLSPGFYEGYYDLIDIISFGTAVRTPVVYGYGIVRVIQVTSLFLIPGSFLAAGKLLKGKWGHAPVFVLFVFAVCVTYTKSIWFGWALGLMLYLVPLLFIKGDKKRRLRSLGVLALAAAAVAVLNAAVFEDTLVQRAFNLVRSEDNIQVLQQELEHSREELASLEQEQPDSDEVLQLRQQVARQEELIKDALGTKLSNDTRAQQNGTLLAMWKQSPLVGHGYGAYAEDCIRNGQAPFMYENTFSALLMKLGIVGVLGWVAFIVAVSVCCVGALWRRDKAEAFRWLGIGLAFGLAVQTNPLLFTFTGFSVLLYMLVIAQQPYPPQEAEA